MGSISVEAEDAKRNNPESNNNGSPTPSREGDSLNSVEEAATASDSCSGRTVVSRNSIVEIPNAIHSWSGQMAIARNPSVHRPSWADMWAGARSRRSALLPPSSDSSSRRSWRLSFSVSKRRQDGILPVTGSNAGWRSQFSFLNRRKDVQDQGSGSHKTNIRLLKCFMHNWFSKKNRGSTGPVVPLDSHSTASHHRDFNIKDIHKATNKFNPTSLLGQGWCSAVYTGMLKVGNLKEPTLVVIKRTRKPVCSPHDASEFRFQTAISTLRLLDDPNLVKLYGYLDYKNERIFILEYIQHGNLREHLDGVYGIFLGFLTRLTIAIDVASAISYLHTYFDGHPIVHGNIKSSNILITEDNRAKVSDYGFAYAFNDRVIDVSSHIFGGYLDPVYTDTYIFTEKSDVYAFGVLLVELMSGRPPIDPDSRPEERITAKWVMAKLAENNVSVALDPQLPALEVNHKALKEIFNLARDCLTPVGQDRPNTTTCLLTLIKIKANYEQAIQSLPRVFSSASTAERDRERLLRHRCFYV
ncbi:calmodulin-binding receptor-like cytoplasmic kinase 2 isoform X1 [Carex rostrata]